MGKFFVAVYLALFCSLASGQALLVSRMQSAISGLMKNKMVQRGFAANDPRFGSTLSTAGSVAGVAAATAVTVSVGAATAPAWITVGVAMGMGIAVSMAVDGLVKWVVGSDGKVTLPGVLDPNNVPAGPAVKHYRVNSVGAATLEAACSEWGRSLGGGGIPGSTYISKGQVVSGDCHVFRKYTSNDGVTTTDWQDVGPVGYQVSAAGSGWCIGNNVSMVGGACPKSNFPDTPAVVYPDLGNAITALPESEKVKPLNPQVLADLANQMWAKAASAPKYDGLPYDASDPITQADVDSFRASNPSSYPTVGDAVAPQPAPSGGSAATPFSLPSGGAGTNPVPGPSPTTPTNPSDQPRENLGPDPNIGLPTLEAAPTVPQILDPIFNLMPSLRSFAMPQHTGTCPKGSFTLFGKVQALDAHCDLLEGVRSVLFSVMAFVWAFIALRITLSA